MYKYTTSCTCHLTTPVPVRGTLYRAVASTQKVVRPIVVVGQIAREGACVLGGSGGPPPPLEIFEK